MPGFSACGRSSRWRRNPARPSQERRRPHGKAGVEGAREAFVARRTIEVIKRLRDMSPLYELAKEGVDLKSIRWKAE